MNRLLTIPCLLLTIWVQAQSGTDTTLVNNNRQRLTELKATLKQVGQSIDEEESREVSNYELLQILQRLNEKVDGLTFRQDSLIAAQRAQQADEEAKRQQEILDNLYYLVLESQRSKERAEVALVDHEAKFDQVAVRSAASGRWHYVLLLQGLTADEVQPKLAQVREKIPGAWFVQGYELKE